MCFLINCHLFIYNQALNFLDSNSCIFILQADLILATVLFPLNFMIHNYVNSRPQLAYFIQIYHTFTKTLSCITIGKDGRIRIGYTVEGSADWGYTRFFGRG